MANIDLTAGNDVYVQAEADKGRNDTIEAGGGDDTIRIYRGIVQGGSGNDRIEKILDPTNPSWIVEASYGKSGTGVQINLTEGWAIDGWGGRDTLIGVSNLSLGTGDDVVIGNDNDRIPS